MRIEDLKVGQMVKLFNKSENYDYPKCLLGSTVEIIGIEPKNSMPIYIKSSKYKTDLHTSEGLRIMKLGYYIHPDFIEKIIEDNEDVELIELPGTTRVRVSQINNGNIIVDNSKVFKKVKKVYTELTVKEIEQKLGISNLKIVG